MININKNAMYKILLIIIISFQLFSCSLNDTPPKATILLYHDIVKNGNEYSPNDPVRSYTEFENDLQYIKKHDYDVISMNEFYRHIKKRQYLKRPTVLIHFDDHLPPEHVLQILSKYNFHATFFINTNRPPWILSWDNARKAQQYINSVTEKQLFLIESHTHNHTKLMYLDDQNLFLQLNEPMKLIYEETGHKVKFLALPYGSGNNDTRITEVAKMIGYKCIRTTIPGQEDIINTNQYSIKCNVIVNNTNIRTILN